MNALISVSRSSVTMPNQALGGQYLTFSLRSEVYAIALLNIKEIIDFGTLTTVPRMPDFVRGVMNLRGMVLPVVDLASRFGFGHSDVTRRTCVVVLDLGEDMENYVIGAMVDAVCEVVDIHPGEIQSSPSFGSSIDSSFIAGMAQRQDSFIIVLDVIRAFSVKDLAMLSRGLMVDG